MKNKFCVPAPPGKVALHKVCCSVCSKVLGTLVKTACAALEKGGGQRSLSASHNPQFSYPQTPDKEIIHHIFLEREKSRSYINTNAQFVMYLNGISPLEEPSPGARSSCWSSMLWNTIFLKQTNKNLRVSMHSYIQYNVFQMDLQGSTLVGKHLFWKRTSHGTKSTAWKVPSEDGGSSKAHKSQFLGVAGEWLVCKVKQQYKS